MSNLFGQKYRISTFVSLYVKISRIVTYSDKSFAGNVVKCINKSINKLDRKRIYDISYI